MSWLFLCNVGHFRIRMFLGLPEPHPDPLVTSTDPPPDPSIIKQNSKKNLDFYCCNFFMTVYL
jgi:hypothetical protein